MKVLAYPNGGTSLSDEEKEGLKLVHITKRSELDEFESRNIAEALRWLKKKKPTDILNQKFILTLHKKMYGNVWSWAGTFKKTHKSIGIEPWRVPEELEKLCQDVKAWIEYDIYPTDEIATRFHHLLTYIHAFSNGNGRHARVMTDLLLENVFRVRPFTWGSGDLVKEGECRTHYIEALREADRYKQDTDDDHYSKLLEFVRS